MASWLHTYVETHSGDDTLCKVISTSIAHDQFILILDLDFFDTVIIQGHHMCSVIEAYMIKLRPYW